MEFEEKQGLKIWWLYLVTGVSIFPTLAILIFDKGGLSLAELQKMYFTPLLAVFLPFLIIFVVQQNKLTLKINAEGLSYRYFPFHFKPSYFHWMSIEKAYIRKFDAFSEYGGYGVKTRLWFKHKDKAYILNDKNRGLQPSLKMAKNFCSVQIK
ncbi:hypothetical protein [Pedobacter jeongneungensis]|uniref:hypothetical protein n=1 Tax=Pedobacter jeongneungensis TaxID=947309 RepID=UPI000469C9AA|nr:hypothetical protein [Pedobacter jeongneungensis]